MKKIIATLLVLATILTVSACKKKANYDPIESTEEEARTVMTFVMDEKEYEVKYELYRAFFLTYKSYVDGGDKDAWTGSSKHVYIERINAMILDRIAEIYAAFAICEKIGFDVYYEDVEKEIKEHVRISIEGGSYGAETVEGYDSYEDYLAALKEKNLNYSVQTLLFRYAIATDAINTHYIGTARADDVNYDITLGSIEYTKDDVKSFFLGDECAMILRASYLKALSTTPEEKAEELRGIIEDAATSNTTLEAKETAVFKAMMAANIYTGDLVIGKYDKFNPKGTYLGEMSDEDVVNAAIGISEGDVSEPIDSVTESGEAYTILYKTYKTDAYFEENYENIRYVYLTNYVGKITSDVIDSLKASISYSDVLTNINYSEIGM